MTGRFASSNPADPNSWRRLGPREKHKVNEVVRSRMVGARPAYVWDASQTDGATGCFDLVSGQQKTDVDAGYYQRVHLLPPPTWSCRGTDPNAFLSAGCSPLRSGGCQSMMFAWGQVPAGGWHLGILVVSPLSCTAASVGNRLWVDTNGNGVQDAGEPDLTTPVTVTLQTCSSQGAAAPPPPISGASVPPSFFEGVLVM